MGNNNTIPISSSCRIIVVGQNGDDALTELKLLPPQAKIVSTGLTLEEIEKEGNDFRSANVLFNGLIIFTTIIISIITIIKFQAMLIRLLQL